MGLDIYAGTLTRYYSHNWKTSVQRWAEENGYTFSKVTPDGTPVSEDSPDPAEVERDVKEWRDTLLKVLSPEDGAYAPWDEDNYREYFTGQARLGRLQVPCCFTAPVFCTRRSVQN